MENTPQNTKVYFARLKEKIKKIALGTMQKSMGKGLSKAVHEVHYKVGHLRRNIVTQSTVTDKFVQGQIGTRNVHYAIWQELLPGETLGDITRKQKGGKPYLRPGIAEAIKYWNMKLKGDLQSGNYK